MSESLSRPKLSAAQKWLDAGIEEVSKFKHAWQVARERAINSGFYFMRAREACPEGEWNFLLDNNASRIKPRTVKFFIQLSEAAIGWVHKLKPETPAAKLQAVATKEIMMLSPKPLVALLRELREMQPFGEYDAFKYRQSKMANGMVAQLELDFQRALIPIFDDLEQLDSPNFSLKLPPGVAEHDAWKEIKDRCERIARKAAAQLKEATDI